MVTLSQTQVLGLGVVLALWLGAAAWMLMTGLRLRDRASAIAAGHSRAASLSELSPALAMVVTGDGRVEGSWRLWNLIGADAPPATLADLGDGFTSEQLAELSAAIELARRTGGSFARTVRRGADGPVLRFLGQPAPNHFGAGSVLLWVYDNTAVAGEVGRLRQEAERASQAFASLSQLIEAAPIPMWYRGADLKLALVNRAYVQAVDAQSAEDVIERGVELIDSGNGRGDVTAARARELNRTEERTVPVTIDGQRRSIRVVDVPLAGAGIASTLR